MDFKQNIAEMIENAIETVFKAKAFTAAEIAGFLETPPDPAMGDFAFPCFKLSRALHKAPPAISDSLAGAISAHYLDRVESVKGYLNFFIARATYAREVIDRAYADGASYGSGTEGAGKTVLLDYSSINIAKRFHIGHLSTTMLGNALYRLYEFLGYKCVGINHLGDWGTQFGKMIAAYKRWGDHDTVAAGGVDEMVKLYVRFDQESQDNPELLDEGRLWFKKIEDGDQEAMAIFSWFKEVTLKDAARVYDMLHVKFDSYAGESFYIDKMDRVFDELTEKGLLVESEGAQVVDLSEYNMPPLIIRKSDGTTIYATRDLAAALYRMDTYHFEKCLYVVAYQQDLHFKQLFKTLELMGYEWYKKCEHVSFGMVSYEGQTLSTRKGHVVYLDDLLDKSVEKALAIINEKTPELENKEEVAKQVGVGAVVFFALYNNRIKDIDFWWDRALSFDGETAPYVQYTHARCASVLRKAGECGAEPDYEGLTGAEAQDVVRLVEKFPEVVREAVDRNEPSMVTRFLVSLAQSYNRFYYECRILDDDMALRASRLRLTRVVKQLIASGLYLIGVEAPEKM